MKPEIPNWLELRHCEDKFESLLAAYCDSTDNDSSPFDRDEVIEEARVALGTLKTIYWSIARDSDTTTNQKGKLHSPID